MRTAPWLEAVRWHDELRAFYRGQVGHDLSRNWFLEKLRDAGGNPPLPGVTFEEEARTHARMVASVAATSILYWVADDMLAVAEAAAESMPPQDFHEKDTPGPCGLVVFETPRRVLCMDGSPITVTGFMWGNLDHVVVRGRMGRGNDEPRGATLVELMTDAREHVPQHADALGTRLISYWTEIFQWDVPVLEQERLATFSEQAVSEDALASCVKWQRRLPLALWTLMQQRLAVTTEHPMPRLYRRRAEKAGEELPVSTFRVVTLRRAKPETAEPAAGSVDWSHRWIVNGFWRNQWLPSRQMHRLQWIEAFVKGPADKPLVVKKTVNKLVR